MHTRRRKKPWYQSVTVWINVAGIAALLLQVVVDHTLIDPKYQALLLALINLLNRLRTSHAIGR